MKHSERQLDVVLCWHMHQPCYEIEATFAEPWVYLHALKDYGDMAAHLEAVPEARAVVNFVPVLLEQLDHYRERLKAHERGRGDIGDPLLDALASGRLPGDAAARLELIRSCFQVNEHRVLARFPAFGELARLGERVELTGSAYLTDQFVIDALVWFHLAWLGEHARRTDRRISNLQQKARHYDAADRATLLDVIREQLDTLLDRYTALAAGGRVELSMSPWGHPILPLLLNLEAAREAIPDLPLPAAANQYPGGAERARWHLEHGLEVFEQHFGFRPAGCWPSEGAICNATLELLDELGFRWVASGGGVMENSLAAAGHSLHCAHVPYQCKEQQLRTFFRDDTLSDLVGFSYKDWSAGDAVGDLIGRLEGIAGLCDEAMPVASVILDGENAWEHYQHNGYEFLRSLYERIVEHDRLRLTTFSEYLDKHPTQAHKLPGVVCGSWVYGTLSTWVGDPAKNRAWDQLIEVKRQWDPGARQAGARARERLDRLLGVCESSDWCWWLGEHHALKTVRRFEALYHGHLRALYQGLKAPVPDFAQPPAGEGPEGSGDAMPGTMLPSKPA